MSFANGKSETQREIENKALYVCCRRDHARRRTGSHLFSNFRQMSRRAKLLVFLGNELCNLNLI